MNGKKSKMLRRAAEEATVGQSKESTRKKYKQFKKTYKNLKSIGLNSNTITA